MHGKSEALVAYLNNGSRQPPDVVVDQSYEDVISSREVPQIQKNLNLTQDREHQTKRLGFTYRCNIQPETHDTTAI